MKFNNTCPNSNVIMNNNNNNSYVNKSNHTAEINSYNNINNIINRESIAYLLKYVRFKRAKIKLIEIYKI